MFNDYITMGVRGRARECAKDYIGEDAVHQKEKKVFVARHRSLQARDDAPLGEQRHSQCPQSDKLICDEQEFGYAEESPCGHDKVGK